MANKSYTVKLRKETWDILEIEATKNFRTPELQLEFMLNNGVCFENSTPKVPSTREEFDKVAGRFDKDESIEDFIG